MKIVAFLGCIFACIFSVVFITSKYVSADDLSWTQGDAPTFTGSYSTRSNYNERYNCTPSKIYDSSLLRLVDSCITQNGYVRFARDSHYIGFGSDQHMYKVTHMDDTENILLPNSSTLLTFHSPSIVSQSFSIDKDFEKSLVRQIDPITQAPTYDYRPSTDFDLKKIQPSWVAGRGFGYSDSGRWLVMTVWNIGIIRIDTQTLEAKVIPASTGGEDLLFHGQANMKISDDGRYIVMGWDLRAVPFRIIEVTDQCGEKLTKDFDLESASACPDRSLAWVPHSILNAFHFSADARQLDFLNRDDNGAQEWGVLQVSGYQDRRLDYLALGDSYSSGEGDTDINPDTGHKYYLPHTDVNGDEARNIPREKCHVSSRSYPFLLQASMHISGDGMKSVACSGAQAKDVDMRVDKADYYGQWTDQDKARLDGLSNISQLKADALREFIPGRTQQIEFVKEYKPKSITLTVGGNDIGFAGKIKECVMPFDTCRYVSTERGRSELGHEIKNQYNNLRELYQELKEASPTTKIYALGYPQFLSDTSGCFASNVMLSQAERIMIRESVTYMNEVIRAAAKYEGVKYIDVEDALGKNTLCGNTPSYVTGIALSGELQLFGIKWLGNSETQESFHPNYMGHRALANSIRKALGDESLDSYHICEDQVVSCPDMSTEEPQPTSYFSDAMKNQPSNSSVSALAPKNVTTKGSVVPVKLPPYSLSPLSIISIFLHSHPLKLGTFQAKQDGSLYAEVTIPNSVIAGFHTLQVVGKTYSGEDMSFNQTIEIRDKGNDIDGDGLVNSNDPCLYVRPVNKDVDNDGIDDGCDPSILAREGSSGLSGEGDRGASTGYEPSQSDAGVNALRQDQKYMSSRYLKILVSIGLIFMVFSIVSLIFHRKRVVNERRK